jgi:hypothetical protein
VGKGGGGDLIDAFGWDKGVRFGDERLGRGVDKGLVNCGWHNRPTGLIGISLRQFRAWNNRV